MGKSYHDEAKKPEYSFSLVNRGDMVSGNCPCNYERHLSGWYISLQYALLVIGIGAVFMVGAGIMKNRRNTD